MVFWKRKQIDLGEQSVTELTILEWKRFFSIKLFHFHETNGKQDRFHTHAFNAVSILLSGDYVEEVIKGKYVHASKRSRKRFLFIPANQYHRITKSNGCKTLLITGPWGDQFKEMRIVNGTGVKIVEEWLCGPQRKDIRMISRVEILGE